MESEIWSSAATKAWDPTCFDGLQDAGRGAESIPGHHSARRSTETTPSGKRSEGSGLVRGHGKAGEGTERDHGLRCDREGQGGGPDEKYGRYRSSFAAAGLDMFEVFPVLSSLLISPLISPTEGQE